MDAANAPALHYNISGKGRLIVRGCAPVELKPHTLVILPSGVPLRIEADGYHRGQQNLRTIDGKVAAVSGKSVNYVVAGEGEPEIILICGFFDAHYGSAIDLFGTLSTPIVEQFAESDRLDATLKSALAELIEQEVGAGAMSAALLKLVIVNLLRRSLHSMNAWVERMTDPIRHPWMKNHIRYLELLAASFRQPGASVSQMSHGRVDKIPTENYGTRGTRR